MGSGKGLLNQWETRSSMASLAEVMVRFLWSVNPELRGKPTLTGWIQCNTEQRAYCHKYPTDLPSALDYQDENPKPFPLPFHSILNMPHPVVPFLFGVGMNLIHLRPRR